MVSQDGGLKKMYKGTAQELIKVLPKHTIVGWGMCVRRMCVGGFGWGECIAMEIIKVKWLCDYV